MTPLASVAPNLTDASNPTRDSHERQPSLPTGPTGVVHRGGGGAPWHKRLALTKAPSPTAHHVLMVLGSFVSDNASDAWPSKATLASMTGRSPRVVQRALRELKSAGLLSVRQSDGRTPHYRLSAAPPETPTSPQGSRPRLWGGDAHVQGGETPTSPEVRTREVVQEKKAAAAAYSETQEVQQPPPVQPPALLLPSQTHGLDEQNNNPQTDTPDRHTCETCQNTWPARYGTTCFKCPQPTASQRRRREQERRNRESEQDGWVNTPDPPPATTDSPAQPSPSPVQPPATPEQAQPHMDDMRQFTTKHKHQLLYETRRGGGWTKLTDEPHETPDDGHLRPSLTK